MDTLALQGMMRASLGASSGLAALIGARIFDRIEPEAAFPYIVIGEAQALDQSRTDCVTDWEVIPQIHVWSRAVGFPECKAIAAQCDLALANRRPAMAGFRMGWFEALGHRYLRDPDEITLHGVLEYRARYGPAN